MDNRDWRDRNSYHRVSHPEDKPRRVNSKRLLFLSLPIIVAVLFLNRGRMLDTPASSSSVQNTPPPSASATSTPPVILPKPSDIHLTIDSFANGMWGQELMDTLEGLITVYTEMQMPEVVEYLTLLQQGAPPDSASDELLAQVCRDTAAVGESGTPESQINDRHRLALTGAYLSRLYSQELSNGMVTITAGGDTTFGQYPEVPAEAGFESELVRQDGDYGFPLKQCRPVFANDSYSVLNCESTFTHSSQMADKKYRFKGAPDYAEMFKLGHVEAVNLANNHAFDYLEQGHEDSKAALAEAGIGSFGYRNAWVNEVNGIKTAFLGYDLFRTEPEMGETLTTDINAVKAAGAQVVVVSFHWGLEYQEQPTPYQRRTGRQAIDAGAHLVLGHHPHIMQGIEVYNGRSIVYSLGNFSFGGDEENKDRDTYLYRQSFSVAADGRVTGSNPIAIAAYISGVPERNNYAPTPVFGDEAQRITDKLLKLSKPLENGIRELRRWSAG